MLPMQINRKIVENYVRLFSDSISIVDPEAYWDNEQYKKMCEPLNKIIHFRTRQFDEPDQAIGFLRGMPLFKMLIKQGLTIDEFKDLIPHLHLVEKRKDEIVFDDD